MHNRNRLLVFSASAAVLFGAASAAGATSDPRGVWIDHTGRGAVEITDCDGALCGHLVWLKDNENAEACGVQILGEVKPAGAGVWDKGWIYDPEQDARFSVELKPMGEERLQVLGYLGTKLFSEKMVWQRAPADLERCTTGSSAALDAPKVEGPPPAASAAPSGDGPPAPAPATEKSRAAEAQSKPRSERTAENKAASKTCKVETPWVSFSFPCAD